MTNIDSDLRFDRHFDGRLMQIFLYITDECNLRCDHCFYKPFLKTKQANMINNQVEIPTDVALTLLQKFRDLGAIKISFLGGEPTLYGQDSQNKPLSYLIGAARRMGFEYIRLVTNGQFKKDLLRDDRLQALDEITFSMDGDTSAIHDALRGQGTYERALTNINLAVSLGYKVHVTMCLHRGNDGRTHDGIRIISRAIKWAAAMGVSSFNIHPLFRMGVPRDAWTGETKIDPVEWISVYREIKECISRGEYGIPVRIPLRFVTTSQFDAEPQRYDYCSLRLADRLDVHPNGQMHTCTLNAATPISVANFKEEWGRIRIEWAEQNNELEKCSFNKNGEYHPCLLMNGLPDGLRPLCVSLKPGQDEFIWNRLHFE